MPQLGYGSGLVSVDGSDLARLRKDIEAYDKGLARAMMKAVRAEIKPFTEELQNAAVDALGDMDSSRLGNEGDRAAKSIKSSVTKSGARITYSRRGARFWQRRDTDEGFIRHPNPHGDGWSVTHRPHMKGWWSNVEKREAPRVLDAIIKQMDAFAARFNASKNL